MLKNQKRGFELGLLALTLLLLKHAREIVSLICTLNGALRKAVKRRRRRRLEPLRKLRWDLAL